MGRLLLAKKIHAEKWDEIPTKRRVAEVAEEIAESGFDSSSALLSANSESLRFVRYQNDARKLSPLPEATE
jgi:hypothetical protein